MAQRRSNCPHVTRIGGNTWDDINKKRQNAACDMCNKRGPNLWLCIHHRCWFIGCGEAGEDHSTDHAEKEGHHLTLNLTALRIWCYKCEAEVFKDRNNPPILMLDRSLSLTPLTDPVSPERRVSPSNSLNSSASSPTSQQQSSTPQEDSETDDDSEHDKPRGLTGLQNIGNTCYMNAALQALSNCPPLSRFLLDCPGFIKTDKKPMISKTYQRLMAEMWHKKRPGYVVPSGVAHGIKIVHPMFRGYTQQDSQEFLRCFMDQLHEELKQPCVSYQEEEEEEEQEEISQFNGGDYESETETENLSSSQVGTVQNASHSDTEYETCDSGMSSERSSVEHNLAAGEECGEGLTEPKRAEHMHQSDTALQTCLDKSSTGRWSHHSKSKTDTDDSGISSAGSTTTVNSEESSTSVHISKDIKDCANLAQQQSVLEETESDPGLVYDDTRHGSDTEFSDAVAELEPLQTQKIRQNSSRLRQTSEGEHDVRSRFTSKSERHPTPRQHSFKKTRSKKKTVEFHSIISDTFDGKILSSVQCLTCERISSTKETFQDLSLPIPSKDHLHLLHAQQSTPAQQKASCSDVSLNQGWLTWMFGWMKSWIWGPTIALQDCLAAFFSADDLKGDNMYSCEKCKKLRNGVKYSKVLDMPEILCIHLKRFRHEFMFSTKVATHVSFPLENLDMTPYAHKDCKDEIMLYDLVAVICHHGTAGGGHYTAYAMNHVSCQWYEFDDQYVTEVDIQQIETCEAYVLFYRKQNEHMIATRQKAQQIVEMPDNGFMNFYVSKQWVNKFNTFAEPGPITNTDVLCKHGGVHPNKWPYVGDLVEQVTEKLWEILHEKYGGGPAVNHLHKCVTCQQELERLRQRQAYEMETFFQLHKEFQENETSSSIYAISMVWFREWENFVRGRTDDAPGSIENTKISSMKNGVTTIRMNSDYGQVSEEMWLFLYDIYTGGPELILQHNQTPQTSPSSQGSDTVSERQVNVNVP